MKTNRALLLLLPTMLVLLALILAGCKDFSFYGVLGDRIDDTPLQIAPSAVILATGATLDFTATGGLPPYSYSVLSGPGSFSANTFTASAAGAVIARVTDTKGRTSDAAVTVNPSGAALAISPTSVSMGPGGTLTFVASGGSGTPPVYTFTLSSSGSGALPISSGDYTAGPNIGTDTIELSDGVSIPVIATVNVTAAVTNVEYDLNGTSIPTTGIGGSDFTYSFTIRNSGTADGTQPVTWWLYLSDNATLGSGDTLLGSGGIGFLASYASVPITTQTGTWPRSSGSKTLFVMIAADDDLTVYTGNAGTVTLSPPDIDYQVTAISPISDTIAGGGFNGTFDLTNNGSSDGLQPVSWTVYVSTDNAWQATDPVVDAGVAPALDATLSQPGIAFHGTWPAAAATRYLIVKVSASDEPSPASTTGNELVSTGIVVTEADVNYDAITVTTAGLTAGGAVTGTFTLRNHGTANGGADVFWTAYASFGNDTLELGTDPVVDAGAVSPPPTIALPGSVSFSGLWPATPGAYYLLVKVTASDEPAINTSDNLGKAGPINISVSNYDVPSVANPAGSTATGGGFAGSFTLRNVGNVAGTRDVTWTAYASLGNAVLELGTDTLVDAGTYTIPRLAGSGGQTIIAIDGTWPATPGNYWLIVVVVAADELDTSDNTGATVAAVAVTQPHVNYAVSNFNYSAAPYAPGNAVTGTFRYGNAIGMDDGSQWVNWTVYASLDGALDPLDSAVAWGSLPPLDSGVTSGDLPFAGYWPLTFGNYRLILQAGSSGEVETVPADNMYVTPAAVAVGIYNEPSTEDNGAFTLVAPCQLNVTFRPGLTLRINGSMNNSDLDDIFAFNTGTANTLTFHMTWSGNQDIQFNPMTAPSTWLSGVYVNNYDHITWVWTPDAAGQPRWWDIQNGLSPTPSPKNIGAYVLTITAN
jgi:hypothetical protein